MKIFISGLCLVGIVIAAGLSACYNDKRENLYPVADTSAAAATNTCDTASITYSGDIKAIMVQNCALSGCHDAASSANGYDLSSYASTKQAADDGTLLGTITYQPGYPKMPQNAAKLPDCTINKIARWVHQGALDN